ncbi:MAG: hypothetical protein M1819_006553 [Sarea resinae]|nr:MAG: hypothetical protein M1819_006553 [Sarea resinae]
MTVLLRRRLRCFYCGCRSAQKHQGRVSHWQCDNCEAVNYLDENGEITDPPAAETAPEIRFAHSIPRSTSPILAVPDESLFCATCVKNQHLLTQSLASYLPSPDHPEYATYEASYPAYRKSLEERYPQVCIDCEPRVRERIRATGYAAKTDHLRRMIDRTRAAEGRRTSRDWDWRALVVLLGAVGWWSSLAGQLVWNIIGATRRIEVEDGLRADDEPLPLGACVRQLVRFRETEQGCVTSGFSIARTALLLGLLSFWWNNSLEEKVRGTGGRMMRLSEYYKLQGVVMAVRVLGWWALQNSATIGLSATAVKAAHLFMLAFVSLCALISLRTVKMDHTPRVSFQEKSESLISPSTRTSTNRGTTSTPSSLPRSQRSARQSSFPQAFPINNLAPTPQSQPQPYHPPTPPPDDFASDADTDLMDWTPSHAPFTPTPISRHQHQQAPAAISPSPFYGRLPPAPISSAHRLRNPPATEPVFKRASPVQQQNFFNSLTGRDSLFTPSPSKSMTSTAATNDDDEDEYDEDNDDGDGDGDDYYANPTPTRNRGQPKQKKKQTQTQAAEMAPPHFFPSADYRTDTGLESLFDAAFSLGDEPAEIRRLHQNAQQGNATRRNGNGLSTPQRGQQRGGGGSSVYTFVKIMAVVSFVLAVALGTGLWRAGVRDPRSLSLSSVVVGGGEWRWRDLDLVKIWSGSEKGKGRGRGEVEGKGKWDRVTGAGGRDDDGVVGHGHGFESHGFFIDGDRDHDDGENDGGGGGGGGGGDGHATLAAAAAAGAGPVRLPV